jgi:hypothetical protein
MAWAGGRIQTQLWAVHGNPGTDKIRKMRELGVHQVLQISSLPFVPNQEVLVGSESLDALRESPDKIIGFARRSLAGDCLHETEHVLGAMVGLTHQKMNLFLVRFPLGGILSHAEKQAPAI